MTKEAAIRLLDAAPMNEPLSPDAVDAMGLLSKWDLIACGACPQCEHKRADVDEQYSYGVYAGYMCKACAVNGFNDACGHRPEGQGNPAELDEPYWEEE